MDFDVVTDVESDRTRGGSAQVRDHFGRITAHWQSTTS
jgi:hypothetical protein